MSARYKKLIWSGVALIILIVMSALFVSFRSQGASVLLSNGSVLQVSRVKVGFTNQFDHGVQLERILGNAISTNGWKVGKWSLQRPATESFGWTTNAEALAIQLKITPPRAKTNTAGPFAYRSFDRNYRILHWGEDGFRYTEEFPDRHFRQRRDGYFGYVETTTYARTSPLIHLEIQNREDKDADWVTAAKLTFRNPKKSKVQGWAVQTYPVTNAFGDFTAVLGAIQVQQPKDNVTRYRDIWLCSHPQICLPSTCPSGLVRLWSQIWPA